ncbi:MAG: Flp pilus assembly protein CpaB [Alphaproteobacteria bacterium]|nr:Flp pilus assembly protein CpaB [Alphaproteobacteria bacterium]MBL6937526.1 Flp pilus assembly protein CpaB [Alphaproteobacteria bacterium]MBL7098864.1 Flp pilus assembly protein CpaB [Alphaproteobacteria bacterium]
MDMRRMIVLGIAVVAAIAAVFLVRGMMGGGTPQAGALIAPVRQIPTAEVLVASTPIQPGTPLNPSLVHWQSWPRSAVDSSFITREATPDLAAALNGTVTRAPIVEGEPLSNTKFVHSDAAGFMAATLTPGNRAISIPVTVESGAGGFILPNDRVDLMMTEVVSDNPKRYAAHVVLTNIRVLAMDQTVKQDKDQKTVIARTATLEVTPAQSRVVARAQAAGPITLTLRPLGENKSVADTAPANSEDNTDGNVTVIRFGLVATGNNGRK